MIKLLPPLRLLVGSKDPLFDDSMRLFNRVL